MYPFKRYIQTTSTLCMYQLQNEIICPSIYFPNVDTLALVRCSANGISNILKSSMFPNLKTIHYLSLHPGEYTIYNRFNRKTIKWLFPTNAYMFYDHMIYMGIGKKDPALISNYIANIYTELDVNNKKRIDLYISEYTSHTNHTNNTNTSNTVINGEQYRKQLMNYLTSPNTIDNTLLSVGSATYNINHPYYKIYKKNTETDFFNFILKEEYLKYSKYEV